MGHCPITNLPLPICQAQFQTSQGRLLTRPKVRALDCKAGVINFLMQCKSSNLRQWSMQLEKANPQSSSTLYALAKLLCILCKTLKYSKFLCQSTAPTLPLLLHHPSIYDASKALKMQCQTIVIIDSAGHQVHSSIYGYIRFVKSYVSTITCL